MSSALVEHSFRQHFARLVAVLARRFGLHQLEAIEDAVQAALLAALEHWPRKGAPEDPAAWLHQVATRRLISDGLTAARRSALVSAAADVPTPSEAERNDELLRMIFVACDEAIPLESRLVFTLKTLCGFDVREVAHRLFLTEENVYKRLGRARVQLRELPLDDELTKEQLRTRLPAVRAVLHALFTEGHLSSHPELAIREELCADAIELTTLLAESPWGSSPETSALLALMHLHAARLEARVDESGGLVLLEDQDRAQWDAEQIALGLRWLADSSEGTEVSRYHAEAGIAAEHCLAASFAQTRWDRIVELYELLERLAPSPLDRLNQALAIAELHGPDAALLHLEAHTPPSWLAGSYLWSAALSDLHRRAGHLDEAARHRVAALAEAPTELIRAALARRLTR